MLICCQVDDLAIGCSDPDAVHDLVRTICKEDGIDLCNEGILNSFNGVDVDQTDRYIKVSCCESISCWRTTDGLLVGLMKPTQNRLSPLPPQPFAGRLEKRASVVTVYPISGRATTYA